MIRHWTGTPPIPPSGMPRRFASAVAAVWLTGTALAFGVAGAAALGLVLGFLLAATTLVPVVTGVCVPSWVLRRVWGLRASARRALAGSSDCCGFVARGFSPA